MYPEIQKWWYIGTASAYITPEPHHSKYTHQPARTKRQGDTMSDNMSAHTPDDAVLAILGKKSVLKRRFSFFTLFGFAVCELITWETVLALFSQSFENGGPAGAVYGFIIVWSSTLSVYTVISELASMAPIAGGQYYWV
jgi:amino acid permease